MPSTGASLASPSTVSSSQCGLAIGSPQACPRVCVLGIPTRELLRCKLSQSLHPTPAGRLPIVKAEARSNLILTGLSARGAVALLVVANFGGGFCGSTFTFNLNAYPYKGRLVVYATAGYGVACFGFGCSQQ